MRYTFCQKSTGNWSFKLFALNIFQYFKFLYACRTVPNYYAKNERDLPTRLFTAPA